MKPESTFILKAAVIFIGLVVLALCIFILTTALVTNKVGGYAPIIWGLNATAVPFFVALYWTLKLLNYIDKNKVFSGLSVKALKYIKYCAVIISGMYAVGMPYIYVVAREDSAPGVILIGLVIGFAAFVIAVFAAVLQKVLQSAIAIKSENDLTV